MTRLLAAPAFVIVLASSLMACSGNGPAATLGPFLHDLAEPGEATVPNTRKFYALLDSAGRAAIDARAAALTTQLGRKVGPLEAIQFRGLPKNARLADVEEHDVSDERATLRLTFSSTTTDPAPQPVELQVVKENGEWRLAVPDLVTSLTQAATPKPVTP